MLFSVAYLVIDILDMFGLGRGAITDCFLGCCGWGGNGHRGGGAAARLIASRMVDG